MIAPKTFLSTIGYCCRQGIHCFVCPQPLMNIDIKVKVNKQKPTGPGLCRWQPAKRNEAEPCCPESSGLRRFELHILSKRFVKIRHYGLLQNHGKTKRLNAIRKQLKLSPLPPRVQVPVSIRMLEKYGKDITLCPKCNSGKLMLIHIDYGGHETKPVKVRLITTDSNGQTHAPP